jgi:hypothetical protein
LLTTFGAISAGDDHTRPLDQEGPAVWTLQGGPATPFLEKAQDTCEECKREKHDSHHQEVAIFISHQRKRINEHSRQTETAENRRNPDGGRNSHATVVHSDFLPEFWDIHSWPFSE